MSSMYLLKEHDGKPAGEVVSVPFGEGKRLIASGVACYWNGGKGLPRLPPPPVVNVSAVNAPEPSRQRKRTQPPAADSGRADQEPK